MPGLEGDNLGRACAKMEPKLSDDVTAALWAPTAGITCPYELTIAMSENARANGADILPRKRAVAIDYANDEFTVKFEDGTSVSAWARRQRGGRIRRRGCAPDRRRQLHHQPPQGRIHAAGQAGAVRGHRHIPDPQQAGQGRAGFAHWRTATYSPARPRRTRWKRTTPRQHPKDWLN